MKNLSLPTKFLLLGLNVLLFACMPKEDNTKIRIVDLNGNARKVTTRYPELNVAALNSQGKAYEKTSQGAFANSIKVSSSPTYIKKEEAVAEVKPEQVDGNNLTTQQQNFVENQTSDVPAVVEGAGNTVVENTDKNTEVVEYDLTKTVEAPVVVNQAAEKKLSKKEKSKKAEVKSKSVTKSPAKKASTKGKFFVQVGSFSNHENANSTLTKMQKFHSGKIETVAGNKTIYRVWLGPFDNRDDANNMVKNIATSGHEAILVKGK